MFSDVSCIHFRRLQQNEAPPWELLLLADPHKEFVTDYLARGRCTVMELNQRVVGEYVLLPTRPGTVELVNVAVDEPFQGKGLGKYLVLHAVSTGRELGYRTMELGTGNCGLMQLALYQKCGFRITGVDRDFFVRNYPEEIFENGIQCRDMVRLECAL